MSSIKTQRLELRPYAAGDKEDYIGLVTDPDVMRHIEGGVVTTEIAEVWWQRLLHGLYGSGYRWCARSLKDARYIGHAMINFTRPGGACELGYILPKHAWGQGFATEIATAVAEYSRDIMNVKEIYATVDEGHEPSVRVLAKIGMAFSGYDFDAEGRYMVYVLKHGNGED